MMTLIRVNLITRIHALLKFKYIKSKLHKTIAIVVDNSAYLGGKIDNYSGKNIFSFSPCIKGASPK